MVTKEYYNELKEEMAKKSVESLVDEFNRQVGNNGWTFIRSVYDKALIETFIEKAMGKSVSGLDSEETIREFGISLSGNLNVEVENITT